MPPSTNKTNHSPSATRILPWLGLAVILLIYILQAFYYADRMPVNTDEGTYIAKGWLFVSGQYRPFEDYGLWTNKMPLSFILPGITQHLFGPGLLTGRWTSIFFGALLLIGLFINLKRFASHWLSLALMLVLVINPVTIQFYTLATTQVIIGAMLMWFFAAVLGRDRSEWQIIIGAVLSVCMFFTRQNLLPLIPLFLLYVFWKYGKRTGWLSFAVVFVMMAGGLALYWPNILSIFSTLMIGPLKGIAQVLRVDFNSYLQGSTPLYQPDYSGLSKLYSFLDGFTVNIIPGIIILATWILWPARKAWKNEPDFKDTVFLSAVISSLWLVHFTAAFFGGYCLNCYSGYLAFFIHSGIILGAIALPYLVKRPGMVRTTLLILLVFAIGVGFALSADSALESFIKTLPGITFKNHGVQLGRVKLWVLLMRQLDINFRLARMIISGGIGVVISLLITMIAAVFNRLMKKTRVSLGWVLIAILLAGSVILSRTPVFSSQSSATNFCPGMLSADSAAGNQLVAITQPGERVYWINTISPLPLTYVLTKVDVYPPQLSGGAAYRIGGNPDDLLRMGFWNEQLAIIWKNEADLVMMDGDQTAWRSDPVSQQYSEIGITDPVSPCDPATAIHVYQRIVNQ